MAALRDEWQAAREMRQQETIQRREDILADLQDYQHMREQNTAEMRQKLAEHYASLQAETSLYLAQIQHQRQVQAQHTAAMLRDFSDELRDRVATLRTENQHEWADRRDVVHETLAEYRHDRTEMGEQQRQMLAEYVDELEVSVAEYLSEIAEERQAQAIVDRAQRHRDREALTHEVQAMRDDFAVFQQQMKTFRDSLRQSVWGHAVPLGSRPVTTVSQPKAATSTRKSAMPARPGRAKAKSSATSARPPIAKPEPASVPVKAEAKEEVPTTEEAVFDYLQSHNNGARLTEIESTLGINRFQAVDALRSLIQKELIVQKDRTYRIQEEAVL